MKTIPLVNDGFAIVDDDDYEFLSKYRWRCNTKSNASYAQCTRGEFANKYMHRLVMLRHGYEIAGHEVDHRNHCGLDNRKDNLRVATKAQNMRNRGATCRNKTGFKGVSVCKETGRYRAVIEANGKSFSLGRFETVQEAAKAYETAALQLHGEFACL